MPMQASALVTRLGIETPSQSHNSRADKGCRGGRLDGFESHWGHTQIRSCLAASRRSPLSAGASDETGPVEERDNMGWHRKPTTELSGAETVDSGRKRAIPDRDILRPKYLKGGHMTSRTETELLDGIENASHGEGPDPIASFDGDVLQAILAAARDRNAAQARIETAVVTARA